MDSLNGPGVSYAHSLIGRGAVDKEGGWSFSAADGNALLGANGSDWEHYGQCHLAVVSGQPDKTKGHWGYPFAKESGGAVKVYRSALTAIRQRAGQEGATAIYDGAGRLLELIDGKQGADAAGAPSTLQGIGTVTFGAADATVGGDNPADAPKRPSFQIHGYTGASMAIDGFFYPVVVDLNGIRPPPPTLPVFRQHDPNRIVGQAQVTSINRAGTEPMGIHLSGIVTGDSHDANEVTTHAKNGFKWQASIGADIERREFLESGKKATVNGREIVGPHHIVRQAALKEVSFVPIGADGATSAAVAASSPSGQGLKGQMSLFETWVQAKGFVPEALTDQQRTYLHSIYTRTHANV